jgi:hypothetical protein
MRPLTSFDEQFTIWITTHEQFASSWRCWKGERTRAALERELERERAAGRIAHLELEARTCGPIQLSLAELVAIGIVREDEAPSSPPPGRARGLLVALVVAVLGTLAGCGSVTTAMEMEMDGAGGATGADGASEVDAGGAGMAGTTGSAGASGTTGAGGAPAGASGTGNISGVGGTSVDQLACGNGPLPGGSACTYDSECAAGSCAGGICPPCGTTNCPAPPPRCVDEGWVPLNVTLCPAPAACSGGYRCADCGPLPGNSPACVYDIAKAIICATSCGDCTTAVAS